MLTLCIPHSVKFPRGFGKEVEELTDEKGRQWAEGKKAGGRRRIKGKSLLRKGEKRIKQRREIREEERGTSLEVQWLPFQPWWCGFDPWSGS